MSLKELSPVPFSMAGIFLGTLLPIALVVAIFMDGSWTFNENSLSDLGVSDNPTVANIFNSVCMFGGVLMAIVGLGKVNLGKDLDRTSGICLVIGAVFLFLVGVFPKDQLAIHICVAMVFFSMTTAAVLTSMVSDYRNKRRLSATISSILLVISLAAIPGFSYKGLEVIGFVCMYIWFLVQGFSLTFSNHYEQ